MRVKIGFGVLIAALIVVVLACWGASEVKERREPEPIRTINVPQLHPHQVMRRRPPNAISRPRPTADHQPASAERPSPPQSEQ